jgi:hypothetical protein
VGSFTEFSIDGYPLLETKSYAANEVLAVFRESDKRVFERKFSERNPIVWRIPSPEEDELENGDSLSEYCREDSTAAGYYGLHPIACEARL